MAKIYHLFTLTLLIEVFVAAIPENDNEHLSFEAEEVGDTMYGEDLQEPHMDLEDHDDLTASGEVFSDHVMWDRKRRSLDAPGIFDTASHTEGILILPNPDEENLMEDMEVAETAIFMPAHLRLKKKRAIEECRQKNSEFSRYRRAYPQRPIQWRCNDYCCYHITA
ncbi:hypothetical protein J6590_006030 [Homalodisca vitripennis]|nr:hypothetical protein J6590_006030 [Homalodisca vitripennis]